MNPLRKIAKIVIVTAVRALTPLTKRNNRNRVWLFSNYLGYKDNPRYLLEYVLEKPEASVRALWVSCDKETTRLLTNKRVPFIRKWTFKYFYLCYKCDYIFVANLFRDVPFLSLLRSNIVSLWHGTPIKKILLDNDLDYRLFPTSSLRLSIFFKFLYKLYLQRFDILVSNSKVHSNILKTAFCGVDDKIVEIGSPRTDIVLRRVKGSSRDLQRIILYSPTWKENADELLIPSKDFFNSFEGFAHAKNIRLLVRFHAYTAKSAFREVFSRCSNHVQIITNDRLDINRLLPLINLLITDHSSIVFDFLPLLRPFILLNKGSNKRGYYDHANNLFESYNVDSWDKVYHQIVKYESMGFQPEDRNQVFQLAKSYNYYIDQRNRERIYNHFASSYDDVANRNRLERSEELHFRHVALRQ